MGSQPHRYAVLLLAYGGPDSIDDVEPYLLDIRGGRETPRELVEEIKERYRRIGGKSPLLERTNEQAAALGKLLSPDSDGIRVYVGMRHWHPYIADTVTKIVADGYQEIVALCLAPHYSQLSIGAYYENLERATETASANLTVMRVGNWHKQPLFLDAVTEHVQKALEKFSSDERNNLHILFTAHSLPVSIRESGDPYERHITETAQAVAALLRKDEWSVCYQSAGARGVPWIGPQLEEEIPRRASNGRRSILVAPIGFVSDHVEIMFDIDIEAQQVAREHGVHLERTESMNASSKFIDALAHIVRARVSEADHEANKSNRHNRRRDRGSGGRTPTIEAE